MLDAGWGSGAELAVTLHAAGLVFNVSNQAGAECKSVSCICFEIEMGRVTTRGRTYSVVNLIGESVNAWPLACGVGLGFLRISQ